MGAPEKSCDTDQPDSPSRSSSKLGLESISEGNKATEETSGESSEGKPGSQGASVSSGHVEPVFLVLCSDKHLTMYNIAGMPTVRNLPTGFLLVAYISSALLYPSCAFPCAGKVQLSVES